MLLRELPPQEPVWKMGSGSKGKGPRGKDASTYFGLGFFDVELELLAVVLC